MQPSRSEPSNARGVKPDSFSCYGRGTTPEDVRAGNVTLGFHESCHRNDFVAYLKAHPLPDPPKLTIGMTGSQFEEAVAAFQKAFSAYFKDMDEDSFKRTDEVGYPKSRWLRTDACFGGHVAPAP